MQKTVEKGFIFRMFLLHVFLPMICILSLGTWIKYLQVVNGFCFSIYPLSTSRGAKSNKTTASWLWSIVTALMLFCNLIHWNHLIWCLIRMSLKPSNQVFSKDPHYQLLIWLSCGLAAGSPGVAEHRGAIISQWHIVAGCWALTLAASRHCPVSPGPRAVFL